MKTLRIIRQQDFEPDAPAIDSEGFYHRLAARAVVFDQDNQVGLLYVTKHGHYKLPGGGLEENENPMAALERELLEELGCNIDRGSLRELGEIIEFRHYPKMIQTAYCYTAKVQGKKHKPAFTQKEIDDGFEILWVKDVESAVQLIESAQASADELNIKFMCTRDLTILRAALTGHPSSTIIDT